MSRLEKWIDDNEDSLLESWDNYKFVVLQEHFHYGNVDWFDEDLFLEMAEDIYNAK